MKVLYPRITHVTNKYVTNPTYLNSCVSRSWLCNMGNVIRIEASCFGVQAIKQNRQHIGRIVAQPTASR
jgi:hypothetical protein